MAEPFERPVHAPGPRNYPFGFVHLGRLLELRARLIDPVIGQQHGCPDLMTFRDECKIVRRPLIAIALSTVASASSWLPR
jgi:hypothetical protein